MALSGKAKNRTRTLSQESQNKPIIESKEIGWNGSRTEKPSPTGSISKHSFSNTGWKSNKEY